MNNPLVDIDSAECFCLDSGVFYQYKELSKKDIKL